MYNHMYPFIKSTALKFSVLHLFVRFLLLKLTILFIVFKILPSQKMIELGSNSIRWTLDQYMSELCRSTYMRIFFPNKYILLYL